MKRTILLLIIPFALCGCEKQQEPEDETVPQLNDYGAFLGRSDNDVTNFSNYKYISLELEEFTNTNITRLSNKGVNFLAYLNVGALENYRDYYDDYESFTFKDYDNWADERWIDVSNASWQNFVVSTVAKGFKDRGAFGVYLDNVDVYSVAKEEGLNYVSFAQGISNVIKGITELGLFVMINGGSEFLFDMNEQNNEIIDSIWGYHQEEVFSLITDYEKNIFSTQNKEDQEYYQNIASMMKEKGKEIFFLEYTTDSGLQNTIKDYCCSKEYHYYLSSNVDLK